jgi:hypothetical protein
MSEEEKPAEATAAPEEPAKEEGPKPPNWEYKKDFAINDRMRGIIHKTIEASNAQIDYYRRKLDRLTYGG